MDKNAWLIGLSERGRFWKVAFSDLTPEEQVFRAIWDLEADVNNGGFDQYFINSSGDTAFAVVDALNRIGARQAAGVVDRACAVFPGGTPPRDRDARLEVLLDATPEQEELLETQTDAFLRYPDNLTDLLYEYVRQNASEIDGAGAA